jgi:hypothetical protein
MNTLLFGPNYVNLTISQARNKWVTGNPNNPTSSTPNIIKEMGDDRTLNELTPKERMKLMSEFVKWEDRRMYKKLKSLNMFQDGGENQDDDIQYEQGGVYELNEDQIRKILAMGGNVEFI